jgi:hypothetical protein
MILCSVLFWMNSIETQTTLAFRILIAGRPVEGQIHLGVGYARCVRGGGDVIVDLVDIALENIAVVHPVVVLPGVGDFVGPDVGVWVSIVRTMVFLVERNSRTSAVMASQLVSSFATPARRQSWLSAPPQVPFL